MSEKRVYPRTRMRVRVKVTFPNQSETEFWSRDISDGGVFLTTEAHQGFEMGLNVRAQVIGMPVETPVLDLKVVRLEASGVGLIYV